jgi:hypothetical protein
MWGLYWYFFVGLLASIYVLLRCGHCPPCSRLDAVLMILFLLLAWPAILTAPYWAPVFLGRIDSISNGDTKH